MSLFVNNMIRFLFGAWMSFCALKSVWSEGGAFLLNHYVESKRIWMIY